jgi:cytochrome c oxidase subunit IV
LFSLSRAFCCTFGHAGLTIRVFTTMTEIDDKLALIAVIVPCCLNLLLLFQVLLLPGGGVAEKKKKKK